ncbi:cholesterol 7-desaturase nvd isoform X2 [Aricia agestis]|uniref:cholesterol 7-desaturase nvd isoform X2 n=1 Tax=Aricia agestis TaxID=91739 RepID=UPI001C201E12|nr:cholesterol 7-desaturase nvd isoform X2 [Aricia agestis]
MKLLRQTNFHIRIELSEVGFEHVSGARGERAVNIGRVMRARRRGELPPPYPNGWYALVESRDLKIEDVVPVDALGENFVVYRGADGAARVVDAYCPHLGANLGVGGTVSGNCLTCPFHQWRFDEDGVCTSIPGLEKVPKGISIKTWSCMETDGAVWVWYDAEGRAPQWVVPPVPQLDSWAYRGRNQFLVSAHIQEIPENGADVSHLNAVHTPSALSDLGAKYPILNNFIGHHVWSAEWSRSELGHMASIRIEHQYLLMKYNVLPIAGTVEQIGPAHVRLQFRSALGPLLLVQSITPLSPLLQRVVHRVYSPAYNAPVGMLFVYAEAIQFARDVAIWNHKRYVSSPQYVKSDRTIRAFRTWFAQFYSEHSKTFRDAHRSLDW